MTVREKKKKMRARQKYVASIDRYAQSLGKAAQRITITPDDNKGKGKKVQKQSKASKQLAAEKAAERLSKLFAEARKTLSEIVEKLNNLPGDADLMELVENNIEKWLYSKDNMNVIAFEALMERIRISLILPLPKDHYYCLRLFRYVQDVFQLVPEELAASGRGEELLEALAVLGFPSDATKHRGDDGQIEFKVATPDESIMSAIEFQLEFLGHYLHRDRGSTKDLRVHFSPDAWQVKLLDIVDNNESVLVSAPTSSGKTFISFYCMEKVLRRSPDGVVVYVAPTKALVNQVAAEVYARFGSVFGVYTQDYRLKPLENRILITVPACLQLLLLDANNARWANDRLQYIIFDEIHAIGSIESGSLWEHLLLLSKCPFLALSATISNTGHFSKWLQKRETMVGDLVKSSKAKKGKKGKGKTEERSFKFSEIIHPHRHADLRKLIFLPDPAHDNTSQPIDSAWAQQKDVNELYNIHPLTNFDAHRIATGFPAVAMEPRDCFSLYRAIFTVANEREDFPAELKAKIGSLDPNLFLKNVTSSDLFNLARSDVRSYAAELCGTLETWTREGLSTDVNKVFSYVANGILDKIADYEQKWEDKGQDPFADPEYLKEHLTELLLQLNSADKEKREMPVLVFNFSRFVCEKIGNHLLNKLEAGQKAYENRPEVMRAMKAQEKKLKAQKKAEKRSRDAKKSKEAEEEARSMEVNREEEILLVNPRFSFIPTGKGIEEDEMKSLKWKLRNSPSKWLIPALERGIGIHHAGMPTAYKLFVERAFRRGTLGVVISTSTLALGIHMPCKTVIFAGDSIYLNPIEYAQMSGRAGRRGFDLLGRVIFFGVPFKKIFHVTTADLPALLGHVPLTTSIVLRSFLQYQGAENKYRTDASRSLERLVKNPLFAVEDPFLAEQMEHHVRFSIEFLRQNHYIGPNGESSGLAPLVGHLFHEEPYNYVFAALLQRGVFHRIADKRNCSNRGVREITKKHILIVLSHLFCRKVLDHPVSPESHDRPSVVMLEPLPEWISAVIERHNRKAGFLYRQYLFNVSQLLESRVGKATSLPLSKTDFKKDEVVPTAPSTLLSSITDTTIPYTMSSTFRALQGKGDQFDTIEELVTGVREGVHVDRESIPYTDYNPNTLLNRYGMDFFEHGQLSSIEQANRLRAGEAWTSLKSFMVVLLAIASAVEEIAQPDDVFAKLMREIAEEFKEKFNARQS
eukprot:TRINITY_DN3766_c0_g1_i2.p1 TRINITY_DN3766_c0_g1~~TRINITY_DN3766_c0_g1_i2.p1  ORF type:complete len:1338 (-),score=435.58 TRINITY_DN3766_c0_g1_i2:267-3875(-)